MMRTKRAVLKIDTVRVYQSRDNGTHNGKPHTMGYYLSKFPTKEYLKGYKYKYMNSLSFVKDNQYSLRKVKNGGAHVRSMSSVAGVTWRRSGLMRARCCPQLRRTPGMCWIWTITTTGAV